MTESTAVLQALSKQGLDMITLVAPNTTTERMKQYAPVSGGFIYVVSVLGTTGGSVNLQESVVNTIMRAREVFDLPLALGFGLKTPDQLDVLPETAMPDAAILGSALLKHIQADQKVADFLAPWMDSHHS